jgi:selenide,water dikinase
MAAGSNVTIEIDTKALPIIAGVLDIASRNRSGGMNTNKDYFGETIEYCSEVPEAVRDLLFDPQTSGGLLISVAGDAAGLAAENLEKAGIQPVFVGNVKAMIGKRLQIG